MDGDIEFTSPENIESVLCFAYGLKVGKITKMDSYFHVNYLVSCLLNGFEKKVVVKIFQQKSPNFFENSELQHILMLHLRNSNFKCSEPLRTKDGETYVKSDTGYLLQVLTFLPGIDVNSAVLDCNSVLKIFYIVGQNLGQMHVIGQNLDINFHTKNPQFRYLPENALEFNKYISCVDDDVVVREIQNWMKQYENNFLPQLTRLRKGYVHGDFSDCNVIVNRNGDEWQFGGIIDFEHCHYGYLVGDLGICMAYFLMKSVAVGCDVLTAAATLIRGYQSSNLLTEVEKSVLLDVIMSRACGSYIAGCHEARLHPENSAVIFLQSKHVPQLLTDLSKVERAQILRALY